MTQPGEFSISSNRLVADGEEGTGRVVVRGERIASVQRFAREDLPHADLQLGDLVLMPGIVDAHVHVNEPGRTDWEGFHTAGRAAAAGGVTTMVAMPLNCDPVVTSAEALGLEAQAAGGKCLVDYGLWGGLVPGNAGNLRALWEAGALGFKCFMVHSGIDEFPNVTERDLEEAMPVLTGLGAVLLAHAEDPATIDAARMTAGLDRHPRNYAAYLRSRPPEAETRAIDTLLRVARRHARAHPRLHIVHISAAESLAIIAAARREGTAITAETCPHYLLFAAEDIADGATQFKCAPPIRGRNNLASLWKGLLHGTLDLIGSDHSPCPPLMKHAERGDFSSAWGGISSLQLTLPALWQAASTRGIDLPTLADLLTVAPARLAGIDAFKGRIAPGYDADLVVFDPGQKWKVEAEQLHHRHKLTPYDGMTVEGRVMATLSRGRPVFTDPSWAPHLPGEAGRGVDGLATEAKGQWIKRARTRRDMPS
ncbi:MAG: allantoinase AllB [Phycisphaerales bacterium]|nr:allantoinase AllB [Phycisphaerales bacterium]